MIAFTQRGDRLPRRYRVWEESRADTSITTFTNNTRTDSIVATSTSFMSEDAEDGYVNIIETTQSTRYGQIGNTSYTIIQSRDRSYHLDRNSSYQTIIIKNYTTSVISAGPGSVSTLTTASETTLTTSGTIAGFQTARNIYTTTVDTETLTAITTTGINTTVSRHISTVEDGETTTSSSSMTTTTVGTTTTDINRTLTAWTLTTTINDIGDYLRDTYIEAECGYKIRLYTGTETPPVTTSYIWSFFTTETITQSQGTIESTTTTSLINGSTVTLTNTIITNTTRTLNIAVSTTSSTSEFVVLGLHYPKCTQMTLVETALIKPIYAETFYDSSTITPDGQFIRKAENGFEPVHQVIHYYEVLCSEHNLLQN